MAVVRPFAPNLAELAAYGALQDSFDITYFYTGPSEDGCRAELRAMGLDRIALRRYLGYTDIPGTRTLQRALDFRVGLGSLMLTALGEVMEHEYINIVDPIYMFARQILGRLRPAHRLIVVRWEVLAGRYDDVWLARGVADRVLARADRIVCTSRAAMDSLAALRPALRAGARVAVIYPGVLIDGAVPAVPDGAPRVCAIARLQWQKGIDDLVAAIAILRGSYGVDARLDVIGPGPRAPWQRLAATLGVGDLVEFPGPMRNSDVRRRLHDATLYCQPSAVSQTWCEQFGFAVVEAMVAGRPVVAAMSGVLPEIVGEDGVFVATRNAASLAAGLMSLVRDPGAARARGARLAAAARARYDAERQGRALLEFVA
jgi:glycosyltransferase involved in cell wall biosynthesis